MSSIPDYNAQTESCPTCGGDGSVSVQVSDGDAATGLALAVASPVAGLIYNAASTHSEQRTCGQCGGDGLMSVNEEGAMYDENIKDAGMAFMVIGAIICVVGLAAAGLGAPLNGSLLLAGAGAAFAALGLISYRAGRAKREAASASPIVRSDSGRAPHQL